MESEHEAIRHAFRELECAARHPFPTTRDDLASVPTDPGVYVIRSSDTVLPIGNTPRGREGLRQRTKNHLNGRSSFVRAFFGGDAAKLKNCTLQWLIVPVPRLRALLEAYAIGMSCPAHLGTHEKRAQP
jgi:hypothetical protein